MTIRKRAIALAALVPLLAGCGSALDHTLAERAGEDCQWLRIFADKPICHAFQPPRYRAAGPPVYCYRTLGDVDCYAAPLAGHTALGSS